MNVVTRAVTRDADRPAALAVLFWADLAFVTLVAVPNLVQYRPDLLVPFGVNVAVVVLLWRRLPWGGLPGAGPVSREHRPGGTRSARPSRFAPVGFVLAGFAFGFTGSASNHMVMVLVGVAAFGFAHGLRRAWVAVTLLTGALLTLQLALTPDRVAMALGEAWMFAVGSVFALALTSAAVEARRRRAEAERLLATVRELTIGEERARMARDMHDSIGHHLTVLKLGLENAERFRERHPDAAWAEVRDAKDLAARALAETRQWVRALRPLDLVGVTGVVALDRLARSFDGVRFAVRFDVVDDDAPAEPLDPRTELVLYRVLQEGLTNALRHSGATSVRVRLGIGEDEAALTVADDGRGWAGEPGFGLTALRDRVHEVGGRLTFPDTATGVTVCASVPVRLPDPPRSQFGRPRPVAAR